MASCFRPLYVRVVCVPRFTLRTKSGSTCGNRLNDSLGLIRMAVCLHSLPYVWEVCRFRAWWLLRTQCRREPVFWASFGAQFSWLSTCRRHILANRGHHRPQCLLRQTSGLEATHEVVTRKFRAPCVTEPRGVTTTAAKCDR